MDKRGEGFPFWAYVIFCVTTLLAVLLCVCAGSVSVPVGETLRLISQALTGAETSGALSASIILSVRLPRVLCGALMGAALSLAGAAMQGLLRNPLADGSTLGVSSGASLGAVTAIAFGISLPGWTGGGTMLLAMLGAFLSLLLILALAYRLDYSLATNTIILIGVIFSMFASSITSLITTMFSHKVREITFWSMGSLSGTSYRDALVLLSALIVFGGVILLLSRELNAFALGESNARHIGVNVRRVKFVVLVCVSGLIGISVSIGGTIGFVGLVIPHMVRLLAGPNHRRLLPASMLAGGGFLCLADLAARTLLDPRQLPIGVVTSFIGSIVFVLIFFRSRRKGA